MNRKSNQNSNKNEHTTASFLRKEFLDGIIEDPELNNELLSVSQAPVANSVEQKDGLSNNINNINNDININNENGSNTPGEKNRYIIKGSVIDNNMQYNNGVNPYKRSDKTKDELKLENEKFKLENEKFKLDNEKLRIENDKLKKDKDDLAKNFISMTKKWIECDKENKNLKEALQALQKKIIELQSDREEQKDKNNNLPNKTTKSVSKKKGKGING